MNEELINKLVIVSQRLYPQGKDHYAGMIKNDYCLGYIARRPDDTKDVEIIIPRYIAELLTKHIEL